MTGSEHYREAERLLAQAEKCVGEYRASRARWMKAAEQDRHTAIAAHQKLDAVRALHTVEFGNEYGGRECSVCREVWPCPTIAALDDNPEPARQDSHAGATPATEATDGETPTEPTNEPHTRVQDVRRCGDCDCFDPATCPYRSPAQAADHIRATVTDEHGQHRYLSTYCVHDQHHDCRRTCKHCPATCICACHTEGDTGP